jgi:hypothetical protein
MTDLGLTAGKAAASTSDSAESTVTDPTKSKAVNCELRISNTSGARITSDTKL